MKFYFLLTNTIPKILLMFYKKSSMIKITELSNKITEKTSKSFLLSTKQTKKPSFKIYK